MAAGDQYRKIEPSDQLIFDDENNLVGIRSGKSDSAEMRGLSEEDAAAVEALLAGGGGGGGITGTLIEVANGATETITAPGTLSSGDYSEGVVIVRLLGATGSYGQSGHTLDGVLPPITQSVGAEVVLRRYTTDGGVTWHLRGVYPGEALGAYAWADRPAASACTGCEIVVTDYGYAKFRSDGTYWRPTNGEAVIRQLVGTLAAPLASAAGTGSGTGVLYSSVIPAGMIFPSARVEVYAVLRRSGSVEAGVFDTRVSLTAGTAGAVFGNAPATGTSNPTGHKLANVLHAQASSFLQMGGSSDFNAATTSVPPSEILAATNFATTPVYLQVCFSSVFTAASTLELLAFNVRLVG